MFYACVMIVHAFDFSIFMQLVVHAACTHVCVCVCVCVHMCMCTCVCVCVNVCV